MWGACGVSSWGTDVPLFEGRRRLFVCVFLLIWQSHLGVEVTCLFCWDTESKSDIQGQERPGWRESRTRGVFTEDRMLQGWGHKHHTDLRILQGWDGQAPGGSFKPEPCGEADMMTAVPGLRWKCVISRCWTFHWLCNWQRWGNHCPFFLPEGRSQGKKERVCEKGGRKYCGATCVLVMTLSF